MSGQITVEMPAATTNTAPPPARPGGRPKLLVPKAAAVQQVKAHVDRGARLGRAGIRTTEDLDLLRTKKQEWVQSYTDLLLGVYDETSAADECNDWVGMILPEYADLELFADQYYEEVAHRLCRLRAVLKRLNETPEVVRRTAPPAADVEAADPAPTQAGTAAPAPPPTSMASAATPVRPEPVKAEQPRPAEPAPPAAVRGAVVATADDPAKPLVARFLEEVGVGLVDVPAQPGSAPGGDDVVNGLNGASFAVVVLAQADAAALGGAADPLPAHCRAALFRLGYLAGRLGPRRVFVMHAPGSADDKGGAGEHGVLFIPLDAAGGWQLQLARGLRRSGVQVDLNRIS